MRFLISGLLLMCVVGAFAQLKAPANDKNIRVLRYKPHNGGFIIENGDSRFTRALYGTNTAFRLETGDMPEFGFFMPNMGGNLQLGLILNDKSLWLNDAKSIKSTYYPGTRVYEIKDPFIQDGVINIKVLAMSDADGAVMQIASKNLPKGTELFCMYGGASNKRFSRNGDLGVDKPDCFDLHEDACLGNVYHINKNTFVLDYGQTTKNPRSLEGVFPKGSELKLSSPLNLNSPIAVWNSKVVDEKPVLAVRVTLKNDKDTYVAIQLKGENQFQVNELTKVFNEAEVRRSEIANTVKIETPDAYMNPLGGVLSTAADAIWDDCWVHGAIGWRMPLNGWRAAYTGDCVGWHDRARTHFDNYAASQVTEVEPVIPHPAQDTSRHFARAAKIWGTQMYSNGYICRNPNQNTKMHHYDMNQCYIDELLWHLNWTGDWDYAKKVWPVIERHLQWEKRNYDPNDDGLYDAYASIWASDALYYNSGAVTHASAYNYRANKLAALIATKIGVDAEPYAQQADKILKAINSKLWLSDKGHWAEYIDFMGPGNVHPDAGIWTIYHSIDSDIADIFQAYQATHYVDTQIPHIPVKAKGLEDDCYETISTTHWFPYSWSINNVAFAEVAHTALAYWQAGRYDEAYKLFKSSVLDGMYLGSSPGNIGQISYYDKARGECYRDFGDPVGMYSRVIIQGLYGIIPDLLNDKLVIQPGFPSEWDHAKLETSDILYQFSKDDKTSVYKIENRLKENIDIDLRIKAEKSEIKDVLVNGKSHKWNLIENVGSPLIQIICSKANAADIQIIWGGNPLKASEYLNSGVRGNTWELNSPNSIIKIYDPQNLLKKQSLTNNKLSGVINGETGFHTLFVQLKQDQMKWWEAINIKINQPFTVIDSQETEQLKFKIQNNQNIPFVGKVVVNDNYSKSLKLAAAETSVWIEVPQNKSVFGTNLIQIHNADETFKVEPSVTNWNILNQNAEYEMVSLDSYFNASVSDIFKQEYLFPRSPYTTLQIPTQGIGEWCHPLHTANIDDSGLRASVKNEVLNTPFNIPFKTTGDTTKSNIAYTTLWDNFPDKVEIPLYGKAQHAYLLMAGSTNHMQCHIPNGRVIVTYEDGSTDSLNLVNPENWVPIEQDLYTDHYAFKLDRPAPYRVAFKSGTISLDLGKDLGIDPEEVYGREIDGGAGIIIDMPLNSTKELQSICVESVANDVVVGLMSLTLMK
ncbi:DUF4450 domain-containing protein [Plebeiibacterium sediminum]|uniref:DUF4450 domain-containing protein n=1 Tax=Plebeiibacterium sediminum TaxID=2992112 RepID=A0AAE3SEK6_9BACT|nr:DUF4450 domain-containing protein [Plebeiobacterium sediminum]MCW3786583.1 DUF4450 domain-containing protein [Plebeiobacterium sediminum]